MEAQILGHGSAAPSTAVSQSISEELIRAAST